MSNLLSRARKVGTILASTALLAGVLAACGAPGEGSTASDYPEKTVDVIVPYPAGGGSDVIARNLVDEINNGGDLGQKLQVINKPGGAGIVGVTEMVNAKPDGYTISISPPGPIYMHPALTDTPYDPLKDLTFVAGVTGGGPMVVVPADSPYQTIEDLIGAAKANPGSITMGGGPPAYAIPLALLTEQTGAQFQGVAFEGDAAMMTAILGHNIDATLNQAAGALPQVSAGTVRVLALFAPERSPLLPDVPTMIESGYDVTGEAKYAMYAPAGVPDEVVDVLTEAVKKATASTALKEKSEAVGIELAYTTPGGLKDYVTKEFEQVKKLVDSGAI